jgi:uncharacterized protein (DUF488 family)
MFYRERILLHLINKLNNEIDKIALQKHLFLVCQESSQEFYTFVPYLYGCFSFQSYKDINNLTHQGILIDYKNILCLDHNYTLPPISDLDSKLMDEYVATHFNLSKQQLIRTVYENYPYYATRSRLMNNVGYSDLKNLVNEQTNHDKTPTVFSIGYEMRSVDQLINELIMNNVQMIVDVRHNAFSMKRDFIGSTLEKFLSKVGIKYLHFKEVGIPSEIRNKYLKEDRDELLQEYYNYINIHKSSLNKIHKIYQKGYRIALLCFERNAFECHRSMILRYFSEQIDSTTKIEYL